MAKKTGPNSGWIIVAASLFIGIGIGMSVGNVGAWTLIGLGAGFLAKYLLSK